MNRAQYNRLNLYSIAHKELMGLPTSRAQRESIKIIKKGLNFRPFKYTKSSCIERQKRKKITTILYYITVEAYQQPSASSTRNPRTDTYYNRWTCCIDGGPV